MKKLLLVVVPFVVSSCGTLFGDKSDKITINSEPEGAEVYVDGDLKGKTPLEIEMTRDTFKSHKAQIKKKGYEPHEMRLQKTFNTTSLFNLGFISTTLGVTSWGIDTLTGGIVEYSPTKYLVTLKKEGKGSAQSTAHEKTLFVLVNAESLKKELAQGGGSYLDSLLSLYTLSPAAENLAKQRLLFHKDKLLKIEKAYEFNQAIQSLMTEASLASL